MTTTNDDWRAPTHTEPLLVELQSGEAKLHGWAPDVFVDWRIEPGTLMWLAGVVQEGWHTLETGAGVSTILFGILGTHHTAISPAPTEHERIRDWCSQREVSLERVTFEDARSQDVLPTLKGDLDLVLIDGDHAFPIPFLDWYYAADRLQTGGLLVVDDTHLRTGWVLRDFLKAEIATGRWQLVEEQRTWAVFRKTSDEIVSASGWMSQPYCREVRLGYGLHRLPPRWRMLANRVLAQARSVGGAR